MKLGKKHLLFLLTLFCTAINAQNFEWLKSYGNKNSESIIGLGVEKSGSTVSVFIHQCSPVNVGVDTLKLDSISYSLPYVSSGYTRSFIFRTNKNGKVINSKFLSDFRIVKSCMDSIGNFYCAATFYDTNSITFNSNSYSPKNGATLIFKLDSQFNVKWTIQTGNELTAAYRLTYSNAKLLFVLLNGGGFTKIGTKNYSFSTKSNIGPQNLLFGEINANNGSIKWSNCFYENMFDYFYLTDLISLKNNYYVSGVFYKNGNDLVLNKDTFRNGGFIIKTDSIGNYLKSLYIKGNSLNSTGVSCLQSNGKDIYFSGVFSDSILWNGKYIKSGYSGANSNKYNFFYASVSESFSQNWFVAPVVRDSIKLISNSCGYSYGVKMDGGFLYFYGVYNDKILIANTVLTPTFKTKDYNGDLIIAKLDVIGNVLWVSTGKTIGQALAMDVLSEKFLMIAGSYSSIITLGLNKDTSKSSWPITDAFLTKLSDNAIIRGAVSSGPYCAGDSIKVPYKKIGDYDTSNYFIAELSDEQGNFTGKHRELGRLKSNQNGTVTGLLPLFKVASSKLYRIRIISTAPVVQSYYKVDTLRLLIYSKDKAWAGNDTIICKGDSLQLETFGGTKWHWSPGYKIQDSTARTPFAWPDKTTTYRITISDSSGCGVPDTAYKTIKVRPEPKITVLTSRDTSICLGGTLPIVAKYSGGDSLGYQSLWYSINSNGLWTLERQQSLKQQDTLNFAMPLSEPDSMRFILYLTDGCTPKTAFATYTLKIKKQSAQANFEFKDTSLCPGSTNALLANFTGSPKEKLSWSWQENTSIANQWVQRRTASNKQSDTWNYKLPLTWKGTKKIRLLLNDACSGLKDTALLNIIPKDTLQLQLNTLDTTLCKGQLYTYKAIGKGGNKEGYKYVWTDIASGDTLSVNDSLKLQADTSLTIRLVLNDGCMPKTTATQFTITVRAPLKITINNPNDTVLCDGQSLTYRASAVGGNGQFNYQWLENTTTISNKDSATIKHNTNQATTRIVQVVLSDGCTLNNDTASINLHYKAPLSQSLNVIDSLCFGAKATLKTKASGGVDNYVYQWQSNATNLSNTDSLPIINTQPGKFTYTSIVTDACSSPDTISIDIVNLDPLKIQLSTSDSCPTGSALIVSQVTGGLRSQLTINWYNKSAPIYQGSTLSINPLNYGDKTFTAVVSDGCSIQNDTASLRIGASPKVKISAIGECLGDTAQFTAKQLNQTKATSYQWRLNGQALAQTDSIVKHFFSQFGPYKIRVDISSNNSQCKGSDSLTGFILVKPKAAFTLAHFERTASGIPFKFINQSSNDNTWLWQFGNGDTSQRKHPNYTYADTGKFKVTLIVSNQNKCFDSTSLLLPVMDKIEFFYPNAFSPNGNGINESFGLSANQWNKVKEYNLKIYNRWGEKVFDSDHMEEHWSGDKAQQTVYIYKANIRDVYNVLHEIEGVVELMK